MKRCLFVLAAALTLTATAAFAQVAQERAVAVEAALLDQGVRVTVGALPPAEAQNAKAPFAIVFIAYEKPFHGELTLRAFNRDGREIGRSERTAVWSKARDGGHQRFVFDRDTRLDEAHSFSLEGKSTLIPQEKSFGDKAKKIVEELLE